MSSTTATATQSFDDIMLNVKLSADDLAAMYVTTRVAQIDAEIKELQSQFPPQNPNQSDEINKAELTIIRNFIKKLKRSKLPINLDDFEEDNYEVDGKIYIAIDFVLEPDEALKKLIDEREKESKIKNEIYQRINILQNQKLNTALLTQEGKAKVAEYKLKNGGHTELLTMMTATKTVSAITK